MYITITPQKLGVNFNQSSQDFVSYLEKENEERTLENFEYFFNQTEEGIKPDRVVAEIDSNTAKLKRSEPKFYSITVNPSKRELQQLKNHPEDLKRYTRELMKNYVKAFNRELNGRPIQVSDINYFAKIEYTRRFKGTDREVIGNQPIASKIQTLKDEIYRIQTGTTIGNLQALRDKIKRLELEAPHQLNGKRIVQGMEKPGPQSHIHIIVSRKDQSNSISLSPGSKYKNSEVEFNGKQIKRGFDRDTFFAQAEKSFDKLFNYNRNFLDQYTSRRDFLKDPAKFYKDLLKLPHPQRIAALKLMRETGLKLPPTIPVNQVQLAYKAFKALKRGVGIAVKSSSIGI
ncbi:MULTISPECIES: MobB family relaxase [unclassified Leeuwenhoekiella]|uniref:MobB family relaxase n=1 Tax=unclassified Leeuwenhoekiella TaxID=2615029 RepID=UPI000C43B84D|nr:MULTISPECIES: MobB family relaxase [unclassified Leeuwenhoekiella]MAW94334.1 mobilization protein [Leeuwenhoekiella sp.]MBA83015.1 mobilization protein [Leeuwenhoekiella sp.]|tara:strand:+ start:221 stop:1252 length:1032 start_codon:yes stop_codon:yes gene_type:complete